MGQGKQPIYITQNRPITTLGGEKLKLKENITEFERVYNQRYNTYHSARLATEML